MSKENIIEIIKQQLSEKGVFFPFISDLTQREKAVLELRNAEKSLSLEDIGDKMKITRERVRQIEAKAKQKVEYKEKTIQELAKKLSEFLFTEDEIGKAFLEAFKDKDFTSTKIDLDKFLTFLRSTKNDSN